MSEDFDANKARLDRTMSKLVKEYRRERNLLGENVGMLREPLVDEGGQLGVGEALRGLNEREFVQALPDVVADALRHPCAVAAIRIQNIDIQIIKETTGNLGVSHLDRQETDLAQAKSATREFEWAILAERVLGFANQRAEIHERLIEEIRAFGINKFQQQSLKFFISRIGANEGSDIKIAADEAVDIAVDHGDGDAESKRSYSRSSIASHTLEFEQFGDRLWERAVIEIHHLFGGGEEIACAGVVAQPLPAFEDLLFRGSCEVENRWELVNKAEIIVGALSDARLLKDHFREPDVVGVVGFAPGQKTAIFIVPGAQNRGKHRL